MPRTVQFLTAVATSLAFTLQAHAGTVITRLSDRQNISFSQLISDTEKSNLVLIGETHTNMSHHRMQLAFIQSLYERKVPLAIGVEMFQSDSQKQLDDWTEGRMSEQSFVAVFGRNWSDWQMYRDIFVFARDHRIPMIALNVPKQVVKKVAHEGFASLTAAEKKDLPQGTTCDLNNPHTAFLKKTFQQVFNHMNGSIFIHFCEAQTLRNSGMAMNIARYLKKHPGTKVVGLTGVWHAIRNAIPEQLGRSGGRIVSSVIVPDIPELGTADVAGSEADYLVAL
jgi:uncharacterized iron-regulated protein